MSDNLLIVGGSGFVSGTVARRAVASGWRVWAVTRGRLPMPDGVIAIVADREVRQCGATMGLHIHHDRVCLH